MCLVVLIGDPSCFTFSDPSPAFRVSSKETHSNGRARSCSITWAWDGDLQEEGKEACPSGDGVLACSFVSLSLLIRIESRSKGVWEADGVEVGAEGDSWVGCPLAELQSSLDFGEGDWAVGTTIGRVSREDDEEERGAEDDVTEALFEEWKSYS